MTMKLYDAVGNSNSRKIRALAHELDMPLETVPVDMMKGEHKLPDFLKKNPNGKVPVLVDGDFAVWESNAILCYVAAKHGRSQLLPTEPKKRAQVDQWLFWQTAHLSAAFGKIMWEKVYKQRMNLGLPDEKQIEAGVQELERFGAVLDGVLATRDYVCGELTVADFALAAAFGQRQTAGVAVETRFASIGKWLKRLETRPSWIAAEK